MFSSFYQCPNDAHWLRFEGVQTELVEHGERHEVWIRWDACDFCKTWYLRGEAGLVFKSTKIEPPKSAFWTGREEKS